MRKQVLEIDGGLPCPVAVQHKGIPAEGLHRQLVQRLRAGYNMRRGVNVGAGMRTQGEPLLPIAIRNNGSRFLKNRRFRARENGHVRFKKMAQVNNVHTTIRFQRLIAGAVNRLRRTAS